MLARLAFVLLVNAVAGFTASRVQAKVLDLHGALLAGGMTGRGSDSAIPDMFHQTEGGAFALELGLRVLVLDFSLRFQQMIDSAGRDGTLLTALFGPMLEIPLPFDLVLRPSLAGGLVFGTLVPVDPPLTNDQLAGKGFLATARFGVERRYGPVLGVGVEVEGGYHYLLGASGATNGSDRSAGWQMGAFATLGFHLGI